MEQLARLAWLIQGASNWPPKPWWLSCLRKIKVVACRPSPKPRFGGAFLCTIIGTGVMLATLLAELFALTLNHGIAQGIQFRA